MEKVAHPPIIIRNSLNIALLVAAGLEGKGSMVVGLICYWLEAETKPPHHPSASSPINRIRRVSAKSNMGLEEVTHIQLDQTRSASLLKQRTALIKVRVNPAKAHPLHSCRLSSLFSNARCSGR